MALKGEVVERVFEAHGKTFADPAPTLSPVQAIKKLSEKNPEFLNAEISSPKHEDGKLIYSISRSFGTKG